MKPSDDRGGYVFSDVPWRFTGLRAKVLGMDPLVALLIPAAIFGLRSAGGYVYFGVLILIFMLFVYSAVKGYGSLREFLRSRWIIYVGRGRWRTR